MTVTNFSPSDDTEVRAPTNDAKNYGASVNSGPVGTAIKWLFKFDLSGIAASNVCSAASLALVKTNGVLSNSPYTLYFYGISAANGDWIEGTKTGLTAGAGEPCWAAKAADGSGGVTTAWAGSAGLETAVDDYENTVLAEGTINRADAQYSTWTFNFNAAGIARITNWFGSPNTNYGLITKIASATNNTVAFSENTTEAYRPVLTVTYAASGIPKHFMHYQRMRG